MSYSTEDYSQMFASTVLTELTDTALGLVLTSQQYTEGWRNGESKVTIPDPKYLPEDTSDSTSEGVEIVSRNRGGNWAVVRKGDAAIVEITRTGGWAVSNEIDWEDTVELPFNATEGTRTKQVQYARNWVNNAVITTIDAGIASGNTADLGVATKDVISISPPYQSAGNLGDLTIQAIEGYTTEMKVEDVIGSEFTSGTLGARWCVISPPHYQVLTKYMRDRNMQWDPLSASLLTNVSALAGSPFIGRLFGVDIFVSNNPLFLSKKAGTDFGMVLGNKGQCLANVREPLTQIFNPQTNQISGNPAWLARSVGDYLIYVVPKFKSLYRKYEIDAVA